MKLVGLSGAAQSGKDTVGQYLIQEYKFERYAFADPLKKAASEMFGIPLVDFYEAKEELNEFWNITPREIAQLLGTEGGRNLFREDLWVKRAELEWINNRNRGQNMAITDVRFPNEALWVKDMGGTIIHIVRPGYSGVVGVASHASEAGYPDELKDFVIDNNGTLEDLYVTIDKIMRRL